MRKLIILLLLFTLYSALYTGAVYASVKMKMVVANPSETETRTIPVKAYLPKGVKPEDIMDKGNFQVNYDFELSLYYIYQEVMLGPKESIILELVMKDIWIIADEEVTAIKDHVNKIIDILQPGPYYNQAKILADNIIDRLDRIMETQNSIGVSTEEKLSRYETNAALLEEAKKDVSILEDLAIETGGLPGGKLFGESPESAEAPRVESADLDIEKLGTVKFGIEVSNPGAGEASPSLRYYLPVEVKPEYIVDKGGLDVGYDYERSGQYVYKDKVELAPNEKKEFIIEIKDIWMIPRQQISVLKAHTGKLMEILAESEYNEPAKYLAAQIISSLDNIMAVQNNANVSVERHIGDYRENLKKFDEAKKDISKLEKLVIQTGGSVGVMLAQGQKPGDVNQESGRGVLRGARGMELISKSIFRGKAPDVTTSWKIIWVIVGFLAVVSFLFFILWWTQIKAGAGKKHEEVKQGEKK